MTLEKEITIWSYKLSALISLNRTDGLPVRLKTLMKANEKEANAEKQLNEFLLTVNPI